MALPCNYNDALDSLLASQIHHPNRFIGTVVVEYGAAWQRRVHVAINRQTGATVVPATPLVPHVRNPRATRPRQVLHCDFI